MDQQTIEAAQRVLPYLGSGMVVAGILTVLCFVGALIARPALLAGALTTDNGGRAAGLLILRSLLWIGFGVLLVLDFLGFAAMMVTANIAGAPVM